MKHKIASVLEDGRIGLIINTEIYNIEAIRAAAYAFTDKFYVLINEHDKSNVIVILEEKNGSTTDINDLSKRYANELLDQQVRLDLEQKFGDIRKMIVEQAFAPVEKLK